MADQIQLRPFDIPVALCLAETPDRTFEGLHDDLGISVSTAHAAVDRLRQAGLVYPDARRVNQEAFLEFLEHGVRYAFPGQLGPVQRGIPTAHTGPALANEIVAAQPIVWPDVEGTVVGQALTPLFPQAPQLPTRCPGVYAALTLVDALRVGRVRERRIAIERLRQQWTDARRGVPVMAVAHRSDPIR